MNCEIINNKIKKIKENINLIELNNNKNDPIFNELSDNYGFSWIPSLDLLIDTLPTNSSSQSFSNLISNSTSSITSLPSTTTSTTNLQSQDYFQKLQSDSVFHNPGSYKLMTTSYNINSYYSFKFGNEKILWDYNTINKERNNHISNQLTIEGIGLCRNSEYIKSLELLKQAIELNSENVDALVTMGACYANLKNYIEAVPLFEKALSLDPEHSNASLYLQKTQSFVLQTSQIQPPPPQQQQVPENSLNNESYVNQNLTSNVNSHTSQSIDDVNTKELKKSSKGKKEKKRKSSDRDDQDGYDDERERERERNHKERKKHSKKHKKKKSKRKYSLSSSSSSSSSSSPSNIPSSDKQKLNTKSNSNNSNNNDNNNETPIHPILARIKHSLWS